MCSLTILPPKRSLFRVTSVTLRCCLNAYIKPHEFRRYFSVQSKYYNWLDKLLDIKKISLAKLNNLVTKKLVPQPNFNPEKKAAAPKREKLLIFVRINNFESHK